MTNGILMNAKKCLTFTVLSVFCVVAASQNAFAVTPYEIKERYAYEYFQYGTDDDNMKFSINNNDSNIFITMKIGDPAIDKVGVMIDGALNGVVPIDKPGSEYWIELELSDFTGDNAVIGFMKGTRIVQPGIPIIREASGWRFDYHEDILRNNQNMLYDAPSPSSALGTVSREILDISNSIVGSETDPRKIVPRIHDWVCENVYYDKQYDDTRSTPYTPEEVIEFKYTNCDGYSQVMQALLWAQNIPCNIATGYAYGVAMPNQSEVMPFGGKNGIPAVRHAWNEVYVDGEWIFIDTTWDSFNIYDNGNFVKGQRAVMHEFYDQSLIDFSRTHVITGRSTPVNKKSGIPSSWAVSEVKKAIDMDIVPGYLQSNYPEGITRREFASLVVATVKRDMGSILFMMDIDKNMKYSDNVFVDTNDTNVLMANMLQIVTGKGGGRFAPDELITRQEAAVMLYKTAQVIRDFDGWSIQDTTYSDEDQIANWALNSVNFVSSSIDRVSGNSVMGSVGNNTFNPKGVYSREQAFISFGRLFNMTFK